MEKKKSGFGVFLGILLVLILGFVGGYWLGSVEHMNTDPYMLALGDAVVAKPEEIQNLVRLTPEEEQVTYDEERGKFLLLLWHKNPGAYPEGENSLVFFQDAWVYTDGEILNWYHDHSGGVRDWTERLEQLMGLPKGSGNTHVSAFWVEAEDVIRPAYVTDVTRQLTVQSLSEQDLGAHAAWFQETMKRCYYEEGSPWTRLGYSYDWGSSGSEYGLTQFVILSGAEADVAWTRTTEEFLTMLKEGKIEQ